MFKIYACMVIVNVLSGAFDISKKMLILAKKKMFILAKRTWHGLLC